MMGTVGNANGLDFDKEEGSNDEEIEDLEWTPDQEILLLYSLHGLKPVGPHKHFRMILIQERFSNAMNRHIPTTIIWKKLSSWYDLEALDEAEAEAEAASLVQSDFELPIEEFGKLMAHKTKGLPLTTQNCSPESDLRQFSETLKEKETESDNLPQDNKVVSSDSDSSKEYDTFKGMASPKANGKESKKGINRFSKSNRKLREGQGKEEDKKETLRKAMVDLKISEKRDDVITVNKKEFTPKKSQESPKKETEIKKSEQKNAIDSPKNQQETPKKQRAESLKRGETKAACSESPKQKIKEEKVSESKRVGGKPRTRKDIDKEPEISTGTKRTKDPVTKGTGAHNDGPPSKKNKTPITKTRPSRNAAEAQKATSSAASPQKRRNRVL